VPEVAHAIAEQSRRIAYVHGTAFAAKALDDYADALVPFAAVRRPGSFVHGFSYSHHPVGAVAGLAVLNVMRERHLTAAAEQRGRELAKALRDRLADHPSVGDIRGIGLLQAVELVADRDTKKPFARDARIAERVVAAVKEAGLLVYHSAGCADGRNGDLLLFGRGPGGRAGRQGRCRDPEHLTRRHKMWVLAADRRPCIVLTELVRPPRQGGRRKREPGANPGLPRSGERERPPSRSTGPRGPGSDGQ
jgi:hypothetical protein